MQHEEEPLQANRGYVNDGISDVVTRDEEASVFSLSRNGCQMMDHGSMQTQSCLSDVSWNSMVTNSPWASSNTTMLMNQPYPVTVPDDVWYSAFDSQYQGYHASNPNSAQGQYLPIKTSYDTENGLAIASQHQEPLFNSHDTIYRETFVPLPIQYAPYTPNLRYEESERDNQTSSTGSQHSPQQSLLPGSQFVDTVFPKQEPQSQSQLQSQRWPTSVPSSEPAGDAFVFVNTFTDSSFSPVPTSSAKLNWSPTAEDQSIVLESSLPYRGPIAKRKIDSSSSTVSDLSASPRQNMSDFVLVFENAPGALAGVKKRKKLEAPVRKAAKDVRRAGACHQCRFRKRTCSTGTPCGTCLKQGGGLHELKCQRESPFNNMLIHQYFKYSSSRRVLTFFADFPSSSTSTSQNFVTMDGVGHVSHPIRFRAHPVFLSSLSPSAQNAVKETEDHRMSQSEEDFNKIQVMLLDETPTLGLEIEQWAVEYTSKFIHAAGAKFHATTMAHIMITAYVKKGLPEAPVLASMLRASSLAFVLRAGVKYHPSSTSPELNQRYRTIQARIDSILYERLERAEADLFPRLQALIFRTAGCLNKNQVYPVALVLWQLMRFLGISASHLGNIVQRFQSNASGPASYQLHGFQLLISTHLALFRSSNPLLLDFSDKFQAEMLGGDKELIRLAGLMKKVVVDFSKRGFPDLKGSIGFRKEFFEMSKKVYTVGV